MTKGHVDAGLQLASSFRYSMKPIGLAGGQTSQVMTRVAAPQRLLRGFVYDESRNDVQRPN